MTVPPPFPDNSQPGQPHPNQPPVQGGPQSYPGQQFTQPPGQQFGQPPGGYQPPPQKQGMSTGLKVFLGLAFLMVLLLGGCTVVAVVFANKAGDAITDTFEDSALVKSNATITDCDGVASVATVEFTSPFDDQKTVVSVDVDFVQDGFVVGTGTATFESVAPGQTVSEEVTPISVIESSGDITCELSNGFTF